MEVLKDEVDGNPTEATPLIQTIEPSTIDNATLRAAIERIKERCSPEHASYYTKHGSHTRYSKGW